MEPMAARLDPDHVQPMRQSLHHLVAKAPWSDEVLLEQVRHQVLPAMQKQGPVVAWIVEDTGFPKKGQHSVGVARQYCGPVGKQENCRVAVSLSVATWSSSLPVGYRLYLPKDWAEDHERREKAEVPEEVAFQTKPEIALDQIRAAIAAHLDQGVVLTDAAYGMNTEFRDELTKLQLPYVVGVQSSITVWAPGEQPLPAKPRGKMGRPPRRWNVLPTIHLYRRSSWRWALPLPTSGRLPGVKEPTESCSHASPPFAYVRPIGMTKERSLAWRNGC